MQNQCYDYIVGIIVLTCYALLADIKANNNKSSKSMAELGNLSHV